MGIVGWIVLGLIAGALAKYIMPGRQGGGIILTIVLGIVGAVVGGFIGTQLGFGGVDALNLRSMAIAVGGALLVLVVYGMAMAGEADPRLIGTSSATDTEQEALS
ncbi:MAG: GlsB/YeaQ/YmgE family stress response membrane protein [Chloroflexota bacterium]